MRVGSFRELRVYREAFGLAQEVFRITRSFPADERFGLISQARRSSRSVCTNLAEAWRRRGPPHPPVAPGKQEEPSTRKGPRSPLRRSRNSRGEAPGNENPPAKSAPPARVPTPEPDP